MSDLRTAVTAYLAAVDQQRHLEKRLEPRDKTAYRRFVDDLARARRIVNERESALRTVLATCDQETT